MQKCKKRIQKPRMEYFRGRSSKWSKINIPFDDKIYYFTKVHTKAKDCFTAHGQAHKSCRTTFRMNIERFETKYGFATDEKKDVSRESLEGKMVVSRRPLSTHLREKELCFICNTKRPVDCCSYKNGGLSRCTEDRSAKRILEKKI